MDNGETEVFARINQGQRIVEEYNRDHDNCEDHIRFIVTIERGAVYEE